MHNGAMQGLLISSMGGISIVVNRVPAPPMEAAILTPQSPSMEAAILTPQSPPMEAAILTPMFSGHCIPRWGYFFVF
jgi:hypothetical protein